MSGLLSASVTFFFIYRFLSIHLLIICSVDSRPIPSQLSWEASRPFLTKRHGTKGKEKYRGLTSTPIRRLTHLNKCHRACLVPARRLKIQPLFSDVPAALCMCRMHSSSSLSAIHLLSLTPLKKTTTGLTKQITGCRLGVPRASQHRRLPSSGTRSWVHSLAPSHLALTLNGALKAPDRSPWLQSPHTSEGNDIPQTYLHVVYDVGIVVQLEYFCPNCPSQGRACSVVCTEYVTLLMLNLHAMKTTDLIQGDSGRQLTQHHSISLTVLHSSTSQNVLMLALPYITIKGPSSIHFISQHQLAARPSRFGT
ncbi:hypothetical protein ACRALDRAFT_2015887 [Sodiomyces alcalophilus JCM 7366]|uniref:uncharacterized protein n=1 Tax=Sodiomyces alcalophilus JCM 7366 TaxID=591952 RepID=UPI0039B6C764